MKYKIGDKVVLVKNNNYTITKKGWKGTITSIIDNEYITAKWDQYDEPLAVKTEDIAFLTKLENSLK